MAWLDMRSRQILQQARGREQLLWGLKLSPSRNPEFPALTQLLRRAKAFPRRAVQAARLSIQLPAALGQQLQMPDGFRLLPAAAVRVTEQSASQLRQTPERLAPAQS